VRGVAAALLLPAALLLGLVSLGAGGAAYAPDPAAAGASAVERADPCAAFSWDVTRERALLPHPQVHFAATPGKSRSTEGHAGLATLSLPTAGLYRIALDQPFWVDIVAQGAPIASRDFQGRPGCRAPHKIVEFELPAATPLTLQFSAGDAATLRVAILLAPTHDKT
jgi:hypothetical protein